MCIEQTPSSMINQHQQFNLFDKRIFERAVITPPMRLPAHMPNEACFYYVTSGKADVIAATETLRLKAEEAVVLKCGNYLSEWFADKELNTCEIFAVHFYPEVLKKIYDKELPDFLNEVNQIKPVILQKTQVDELLKTYISSLMFYFDNTSLASDELIKLKLKELILLLAKTDNAATIKQLISGLFTSTEYSLKEIVEANIYSRLTIEEFAKLTNLSLSTFKREFDKVYGKSPAKYIKERKLERSAELLLKTSQRISEIAFNCGFSEVAHFSNSFQKQYGLSPSVYRLNQTDKSMNEL